MQISMEHAYTMPRMRDETTVGQNVLSVSRARDNFSRTKNRDELAP